MSQYPIRAISELTGVPATTLRAWERRYGLLKPTRTDKGHRLYSLSDVDLIKDVVSLLKSDHTISEAIKIIKNPDLKTSLTVNLEGHWAVYQNRLLKAIEQFNDKNLDNVYNEVLSLYPIDMVTEKVIIPVLHILGDRWEKREAGIAEEHFFSAFLRNKLGARLNHESSRGRGAKLLVACLPGEYHELGILLFCMAAIGHGYQILYLGTNLPPSQVLAVIKRSKISGVLFSGTKADLWDTDFENSIKSVIKSADIPFMIGGELSESYHEQLRNFGLHTLGSDHAKALSKLENIVSPFSAKA